MIATTWVPTNQSVRMPVASIMLPDTARHIDDPEGTALLLRGILCLTFSFLGRYLGLTSLVYHPSVRLFTSISRSLAARTRARLTLLPAQRNIKPAPSAISQSRALRTSCANNRSMRALISVCHFNPSQGRAIRQSASNSCIGAHLAAASRTTTTWKYPPCYSASMAY